MTKTMRAREGLEGAAVVDRGKGLCKYVRREYGAVRFARLSVTERAEPRARWGCSNV